MKDRPEKNTRAARKKQKPINVRLPGFISDKDIGLGDVIKHAISAIGIRPCADCLRRAETLNRWVVFTGRQ